MFVPLALGLPALLRTGRVRHGRLDADRRPVRHRSRRRLHDPGRALPHHHQLRRGPAAHQGPALWLLRTAAGGFSIGLVVGGLFTAVGWRRAFFAPVVLSADPARGARPRAPDATSRPHRPERRPGRRPHSSPPAVVLLRPRRGARRPHPASCRLSHARRGPRLSSPRSSPWSAARIPAGPPRHLPQRRPGPRQPRRPALRGASSASSSWSSLYLQELRDWSTLQTSFAMIVIGVDAILSPVLTSAGAPLRQRPGDLRRTASGRAVVRPVPAGRQPTPDVPAMLPALLTPRHRLLPRLRPLTASSPPRASRREEQQSCLADCSTPPSQLRRRARPSRSIPRQRPRPPRRHHRPRCSTATGRPCGVPSPRPCSPR